MNIYCFVIGSTNIKEKSRQFNVELLNNIFLGGPVAPVATPILHGQWPTM